MEVLQKVIYSINNVEGVFTSDELFMLHMRNTEEEPQWSVIPVVGSTPGKRYGHTLVYSRPNLILFGGNNGVECVNDVWILNMEQKAYIWTYIEIPGSSPSPRLYHSASICTAGNAATMMIIFGGRGSGQVALQDAWGLRRHRNGKWDWIIAPYKSTKQPSKRYQHGVAFLGTLMFIVGGRTSSSSEQIGLEVYNTETSEWSMHRITRRLRHGCWISHSNLYIYGGFEYNNPSLPTDTLIKIDLNKLFAGNEVMLKKVSESEVEPFASEWNPRTNVAKEKLSAVKPSLVMPELTTEKESEESERPAIVKKPTIRDMLMGKATKRATKLASTAIVAMPSSDPNAKIFKIVPLETKESMKVVVNIKGTLKKAEDTHSIFLNQLLKPKNWATQPEFTNKFNFKPEQITSLANQCIKVIKMQPMVVYLRAPVKVFGDIHGQYQDLMRFFDLWGTPSEDSDGDIEAYDYLFLGDYVDRGSHSLETICLLMALKVKYPKQVYLLRGNHEDRWINRSFGFADECSIRLDEDCENSNSTFNKINEVFDWLPLAAIIDDKIICLHGGIGESVRSISQIESLERPLEVIHEVQNPTHQLVVDILWSDPTDSDKDLGVQPNYIRDPNETGKITKYGPDKVEEFLSKNNLNMILRGHECVMDGFERFAGGLLITVFSATDYCGRHKNAGAVLFITRKFEIIPKLIYPLETGDNNWLENDEAGSRPSTPPRWSTTRFNADNSFN